MGIWNSHVSVGNIAGSAIAGIWSGHEWYASFILFLNRFSRPSFFSYFLVIIVSSSKAQLHIFKCTSPNRKKGRWNFSLEYILILHFQIFYLCFLFRNYRIFEESGYRPQHPLSRFQMTPISFVRLMNCGMHTDAYE